MEEQSTEGKRPTAHPLATPRPWDLVADAYSADLLPWSEPFAREALRLAALPPSSRVVDVATGPGTLALLAAQEGATVSALDFSAAMVANLRRRAIELGVTLADVRVGDGQDLPYDDGSFDAAFSLLGLIFFPDRAAGFRELYRVLRPGGRAVVSSIASIEGPFPLVKGALGELLPDVPFASAQGALGDAGEFADELRAAGFREVTIHTITRQGTTPTMREYWHILQHAAASVAMLRRRLGDQRWAAVSEGVLARLHDARGDGPVDETTTMHIGVGTR